MDRRRSSTVRTCSNLVFLRRTNQPANYWRYHPQPVSQTAFRRPHFVGRVSSPAKPQPTTPHPRWPHRALDRTMRIMDPRSHSGNSPDESRRHESSSSQLGPRSKRLDPKRLTSRSELKPLSSTLRSSIR
ncbi:hypothetical protein PtA15_9A328 [Puccinia triticina]|uniref:Uncharacterized protein n=2 Tax=Puccinia triticina TaxID=208348 RepID=A0ABY7CW48_9BASI|nr:uncharacterized protein PtA15_9A328 [Puccinia triticina]WAQ88202.1 hypothetical protein PtA15_9A328 [Puccinia triticina]